MIARESKLFLTAVQFLTRLPTPQFSDFRPEWLTESGKYFPLVGALVGGLAALVLLIAAEIWDGSTFLPVVVALAAAVAMTGAFHEDGLADFFDSLGGATREARLEIMKDSRIGTFGVMALLSAFALKAFALAELSVGLAAAALIAAHAGGRLAVVSALALMPYAGRVEVAKVRPLSGISDPRRAALACAFGLMPLLLLPWPHMAVGLVFGLAAAVTMALLAKQTLGGITGDVLGAIEQAFETGFLLGVAACALR